MAASRSSILRASQTAAEIYQGSGAAKRIEQDGYTRVDPFVVAEYAKLQVMLQPMEALLGAFIRDEISGILVNADRPVGLVHMTCAHELGHYFMGHETTSDQVMYFGKDAEQVEQEADWFAYQLLMPRSLIAMTMRRKGWGADSIRNPEIIYQLSLRLGTSYKAMVWSLYRHKLTGLSYAATSRMADIAPQLIKRKLLGGNAIHRNIDVWKLEKSDRDTVIEARPDDIFLFDLPSHAAAGYLWNLNEASMAGFHLRPETIPSQLARAQYNEDQVVGGRKTQRYVLDHAGNEIIENTVARVQLNFVEAQPWSEKVSRNDEFKTSAEYEKIEHGLSRLSRERLIEEIAQR